MRRVRSAAVASGVVVFVALATSAGCNAILDNQPGVLTEEAGSGTEPTEPTPAPPTPEAPDAEIPDAEPAPDAATPPDSGVVPCALGELRCFGACVSSTDPRYGCGDPSCAPCATAHDTTTCAGGRCAVASCDVGYADCNASAADGCETDLSKPQTCGACNATCTAVAPLCTATGATFQCTNGCTPAAPVRCGAECADVLTSAKHCGDCNVACTAPAGGVAACVGGVCNATCPAATHACGGACVADTSANACGPACTVCPVPPGGAAACVAGACTATCLPGTHACAGACVPDASPAACGPACLACPALSNTVAACVGGACAYACAGGFADCDAVPTNGCEAQLVTDPLHCGACGRACEPGQACRGGKCK